MSEIISKNNNDNNYNKYTNYFKQKEIGTFLDSFLSEQADKIFEDLNNSYEKGDLRNCNEIIKKLNENRLFKIFSSEKKIALLDLIIKKILPNLIGSSSNILNFLTKIRFLIPKNYTINWKFFYSLYYLLYNKYRHEIANYIPLFKSLHKYIPLSSFTNDDYLTIKKSFLEDLYKSNKSYAISTFMYFLPKKYIEDDYDLHYKLFLLFKNCKNYFVGNCCMFSKILKKNGKLNFDKNKEKNEDLIKIFIKYFFTNLNLYIIDDSSVKNSNYSSPMYHNNDKNKKKNKFDHSVIDVLLYLIFNTNLNEEKYSQLILSNLKLILNNKHLYIKEKSNSNIAKNFIKFITEFIHRLFNSIFYTKHYEEEINKKIKKEIEYNKDNEFIFNKLLDVIKIFNICFKKLFLYENDGTFSSLQKLFNYIGTINADKIYMEKLLENIDFKEYIKMLKFFTENIETKAVKFTSKLQTILPLLLNEYIYSTYPEVKEFIKDTIILLSNSISSANIEFDVNILILFSTYFFDIKNKIKKSKIYESLIPIIKEASIKIMNNVIGFLDLICIKHNSEFCFFVNSMEHFLDENDKNIISKKYADYIQNYEIESKYLKYYFNVIDKKEHEYIFNYVYNNMIYVDNGNDVKINEYFLYPEKDDELKINVKYCSLEIFEKQINKYQNIISLLDYSKILTSEKNIKHFYQIYFTLINKEETNFKRLAIILFKSFLNSFINSKIKEENNEIIIEYPKKENIILINNIYKKVIIPYEKYIKENLNEINKKKLEQIIFIYMMLINVVNETKLNIILLLNNDIINIDKIGTEYINAYKEYLNLISNSENVIKQIYQYNNGEILKDQNINNHFEKIILNKLMMNTSEMTNKRTSLREKKSFLFQYYHLSTFKNYWLKKKIKVMNYNYFSLLKNFVKKDNFYYDCVYIFAKNITGVNQASNAISYAIKFLYCLDKNKIKEIYDKIYNEYKEELINNIKEESETEKNKMKNISEVFFDFSFVYINLFPKDIIPVLIKLGNIFTFLKIKKFDALDKLLRNILMKIKSFIYLPLCSEKDLKKIFDKFAGRNSIINNEFGNVIDINEKIKEENKAYYVIIKQVLNFMNNIINDENSIIKLFTNEIKDKNNNNINLINDREKMFIFFRLKEYIIETLDKNDELYQKIIKSLFDNIFSQFIPVSSKYMWMRILHSFIKDEYNSYKSYNNIIFKSEEEFNNKWKDYKYEIKGKKKNEILPVYISNIRISKFKYEKENDNKVKYYNINIKEFIEIMKQIEEWIEEKTLINANNINKYKEALKKFMDFDQENKGLDFKKVKTFYYLLELNYIQFNDYIKNYKISDKDEKSPIIYEFLLAKYIYMLNKNIFTSETKKEFWEILNIYTNGANKKEDEKIITYFKFLFNICSLEQILNIFDIKDLNIEFHIDFVSKLFNLYSSSFSNLKPEKNIFEKKYCIDIINKIFENDGNLILYSNELKHVIKVYFQINHYINYDYNTFEEIYNKKEIIDFFINNFITKDFSKRSRYILYELYINYFDCLNDTLLNKDDFTLFNLIIPKIALCANEFKDDSGNKIIQNIEGKFRGFNSEINFPILCEKISQILKTEENSNDANKLLYLQIVNIVYNNQKFLNFKQESLEENKVFKNIYEVFAKVKNENIKIKFSTVFASFFNDFPEEENENFVKKNEKTMLENDNYIYIIMSQLLRFRMSLPLYLQEFIIKLKDPPARRGPHILWAPCCIPSPDSWWRLSHCATLSPTDWGTVCCPAPAHCPPVRYIRPRRNIPHCVASGNWRQRCSTRNPATRRPKTAQTLSNVCCIRYTSGR